jgi:hypothetical protein
MNYCVVDDYRIDQTAGGIKVSMAGDASKYVYIVDRNNLCSYKLPIRLDENMSNVYVKDTTADAKELTIGCIDSGYIINGDWLMTKGPGTATISGMSFHNTTFDGSNSIPKIKEAKTDTKVEEPKSETKTETKVEEPKSETKTEDKTDLTARHQWELKLVEQQKLSTDVEMPKTLETSETPETSKTVPDTKPVIKVIGLKNAYSISALIEQHKALPESDMVMEQFYHWKFIGKKVANVNDITREGTFACKDGSAHYTLVGKAVGELFTGDGTWTHADQPLYTYTGIFVKAPLSTKTLPMVGRTTISTPDFTISDITLTKDGCGLKDFTLRYGDVTIIYHDVDMSYHKITV